MAFKFVIGSIVRLKSGGPWTTVTKDRPETGSKFVEISWFNGSELATRLMPKDAFEHDPARTVEEPKVDKSAKPE